MRSCWQYGCEVSAPAASLASADPDIRAEARQRLVREGSAAVPALTRALSHPATHVRWEAANALTEIADPSSAPALVRALEDSDRAVRWLAAEALIKIGCPALPCLLDALVQKAESGNLRNSAHHVVHDMMAKDRLGFLEPVEKALENPRPASEVPAAAEAVLTGPLAQR